MKKLRSKEYTGGSLLNPEFQYRSSAATDIRETFERVRREQEEAKVRAVNSALDDVPVLPNRVQVFNPAFPVHISLHKAK